MLKSSCLLGQTFQTCSSFSILLLFDLCHRLPIAAEALNLATHNPWNLQYIPVGQEPTWELHQFLFLFFCFEGDLLIEVLFRLARGYHLHYPRIESKTTGKTCEHVWWSFKLVSNMSIFFSAIIFCCLGPFLKQPAPRGVRRQGNNYFALPKKEPGELLEGAIPCLEMKHNETSHGWKMLEMKHNNTSK